MRRLCFNSVNAGIVIYVFGAALAIVGIARMLRGPVIAAALASAIGPTGDATAFDYYAWLRHWKLTGITIICGGVVIAVAGTAPAFRKR